MINGKEGWKNKELLSQEFIKKFNIKYNTNYKTKDEIISKHEDLAFGVLRDMYVDAVKKEKVDWEAGKRIKAICEERARKKVNKSRTKDRIPFDELPVEEKDRLIKIEEGQLDPEFIKDIKNEEEAVAERIANLTISRLLEMQRTGKIRQDIVPPITPFDILFNITEGIPKQEDYLVEQETEAWLARFCGGTIPRTQDGKIDLDAEVYVYCFQNGDMGAGNFMKFAGNIGPNNPGDGYFVFSELDYQRIISDKEIFDEQGKCKDIAKLSARLGNVPLGSNPICIRRKIKIGDLKTSNGSFSTAYFGEFGPPLTTQGGFDENGKYIPGMHEAIIPSTTFMIGDKINPDIEIISHSKNITTEELLKMAQTLLVRSKQFSEKESIDHWTLVNGLDNDIDILNRFKAILTKEEQKYISQLMVYLRDVMLREQTAQVGGATK